MAFNTTPLIPTFKRNAPRVSRHRPRLLCMTQAPVRFPNSTHVDRVQRTWQLVEPIKPQAGAIFYEFLFEKYPQVRSMFKSDMQEQQKRLIEMVDQGVKLLDQPDQLEPTLRALGKRHVRYRTQVEHYPAVKDTLMRALETALGEKTMDADARTAWSAVYDYWAGIMIDAMMECEEPGEGQNRV
ncbi:hypothetical protein CDCA_CDCA04G1400 [Cyanidium caldarium]|uniref:Globin domain-containing protein n=1 Tax=Cyanidium caldarium TaxID=2771 RepID=A0AAV9ITE9_CYACA|nr:hypothetical protein CDCA_CDCA04G1400 [Cyanidium caldarium]